MRDKAYKRDLKRALLQIPDLKVVSIATKSGSHLSIVVVLPNGTESEFTAAGSPSDHQISINNVVRTVKKRISGVYK